jgi:hypothetical protein
MMIFSDARVLGTIEIYLENIELAMSAYLPILHRRTCKPKSRPNFDDRPLYSLNNTWNDFLAFHGVSVAIGACVVGR